MQRLIDAYVLNAEFEEIIDFLENNVQAKKTISKEEVCECIKALRECVDEQPTAYDVEKVVAKLNKALGKLLHICSMEDVEKVYNFYDLMEEIVRKGGVE